MARIYHVVAAARNRVIGKDNKLPWHFSEDLRYFKKLTTGSTVIMGRKTFESIYLATKGKLLPGRQMIVLTRKGKLDVPVETLLQNQVPVVGASSIAEAATWIQGKVGFIIGGAEIYKNTMNSIDGIYLTRIDADYKGDAYYPEVPDDFEEVEIQCLREVDPRIDVVFYERKERAGTSEGATA